MQPSSVKTKTALSVSILILALYLVSTFVVLSLFQNQIKEGVQKSLEAGRKGHVTKPSGKGILGNAAARYAARKGPTG